MKIALYKGTSTVSKSILFFSRGGYSHAAIVLNDGSVIEAKEFHGVQKRKSITDAIPPKYIIDIYELPTTPEQDEAVKNFLEKQLGKGYDYWSVIGFVVYASKEARKSYGRWFCSELVFATMEKIGIQLLERVGAWKVSPTILSYNTAMKFVERINYTKGVTK